MSNINLTTFLLLRVLVSTTKMSQVVSVGDTCLVHWCEPNSSHIVSALPTISTFVFFEMISNLHRRVRVTKLG